MATVSLRHVYKQYENNTKKKKNKKSEDSKKYAVSDFCMDIDDKEFIVFVGPSGCGKSTTLRMVAGLEDITEGEIYIDGELVNDVEPKDRNIAMVFQNYALYPHMTVYENMAFGLTFARIPKEERDPSTATAVDKNGKRLNPLALIFKRVPKEKRDKEGNVIFADGEPVYEYKTNKDGSCKKDAKGNPVVLKRRYTLDEKYGKPVFDENGAPKYIAKKNKDGSVKTDANGKPVYRLRKYTKFEIDLKVREAASILAIEQYLGRKPKALSGGQRQRVALGRTIVRKPKVFLLDEPLSNLDAKLRASMRAEIIKLHERLGATFIYVTHDQVEAMTMGTRIVIMKDGVVQQIGAPQELYERPVNEFVAGFIGTPQMNFFEGRIAPDGKIAFCGNYIRLPEKILERFDKDKIGDGLDIILGLRPSDLKLADKPVRDLSLKCETDVVEALGNETIIYANICGGDQSQPTAITLSVKVKNSPKPHTEVYAEIDPECVHIFDKQTRRSLLLNGD